MEKDKIVMRQRELQRAKVLEHVVSGAMTLIRATPLLGVGYRQAKRLVASYREDGAAALAHGNRGRPPWNKAPDALRRRIVALYQAQDARFNDTHFAERLAEREGLAVGRDLVRRTLRDAGIPPKRKRRPPQHRRRRERQAARGAMMLWDGSTHPWFGPDRPPCCLTAALDDARGEILAARFDPAEASLPYLHALHAVVAVHGIPASVYQDGHAALFRNDDHWSLDEQLRGEQDLTQVGTALRDLGVRAIRALSPQAKGRVERLFATLQDRLVAELAADRVTTSDRANAWLPGFVDRFNRRFARPAAQPQSLFRSARGIDLDLALSFRYRATVGNDNAVRLGGLVLDVPPGPRQRSWAHARVDVRQLRDGSWRVLSRDRLIASHPPTALHEPLRRRKRRDARGAAPDTWIVPGAPDEPVAGSSRPPELKRAAPSAVAASSTAPGLAGVKGGRRPSAPADRRPLTPAKPVLSQGDDRGRDHQPRGHFP